MKEIAVIFNTNQLGGAERSLIEQLSLAENQKFIFFIPTLKLPENELVEFLKSKKLNDVQNFSYPGFLYKLSRRDFHKLPLAILSLPSLLFYILNWHKKFKNISEFYVNGNKAILPVLGWSLFTRNKIHIIWHFRDFPSPKAFSIIGRLFCHKFLSHLKLKIIANSHAVENELKKYFPDTELECLYNLAGTVPEERSSSQIRQVGVVSMLAPWKGLHNVVLMAKLYEKELLALGIQKISFYGEGIYQTAGEHQNYPAQLKKLSDKLKVEIIDWKGKIPPYKIFSDIDLLIHSSIQPEPFGRVIIEAFKSKVPVISTGLGGAGELIGEKNAYGLKFDPFDHTGLFHSIKKLCENPEVRDEIIADSFKKSLYLEAQTIAKSKDLFINILRLNG